MLKISWPQAAAWRMRRHHLTERAPAGSMLAVAGRLCGLHAQVLSSAALAVWARVDRADRQAVPRALWEERTLVKTWAMRGTLHLLPSGELPMWHAALGTSRRYRSPAIWRRFGLTLAELDRVTEAIATALCGRVITREELAREVGRITKSAKFSAKLALGGWSTILKPAAFAGALCFGPSVGQRVQFTSAQTWVEAAAPPPDPQAATASVARRFLAAYGPATDRDLARWWGGCGVASARKWIAGLGDEVAPVELGNARAWMLAADARELKDLPPQRAVRLLPAFDPYVIGASPHAEHLLPANLRSRVYRPQGWVSPVLLVNGLMEGIWRHEPNGSRVDVVVEPFGKAPPWVRRAAAEEAERLAAYLGATLNFACKS